MIAILLCSTDWHCYSRVRLFIALKARERHLKIRREELQMDKARLRLEEDKLALERARFEIERQERELRLRSEMQERTIFMEVLKKAFSNGIGI